MPDTARSFRVAHVRDFGADCGHAMPFDLGKKAHVCAIVVCDSAIFALIRGRSVPISRGSPLLQHE